jgi:hypothetical protein
MLDLGADQVPKALGLAIPSTLLASADEVIEQTSQCRLMGQSRHYDRADPCAFEGEDGVIGRSSLWIAEDLRCCASG